MVPAPMISTPLSAWILRIENMRSCLRIVDAPSMPICSDISTSSAGVLVFSSFKCIKRSFLGELFSSLKSVDRAGGRQDAAVLKKAAGDSGKLAGAARDSRYVSQGPVSISAANDQRRTDQKGRTIT